MNPNEHGEVFVTEDGGEIDQDFGHYERFTAQPCRKIQNITSGKVFLSAIEKGRKGQYLGKTVQVIPHVRDEHKFFIREAAKDADVAVVEIGGTIGDDEAIIFLRAIQSMIHKDKDEVVIVVLVPLVFNESVGEPKTKIAQNAIRMLNEFGLAADFIVVRTPHEMMLDSKRKEKLSLYCNVPKENIIADPDLAFVYELPVIFEQQKFGEKIISAIKLPVAPRNWNGYDKFLQKLDMTMERIPIAYIGKYVAEGRGIHKDAYISVEEALTRACIESGFLPEIHRIDAVTVEHDQSVLKKMAGIIVPGGYGCRGLEGKIAAIKYARESGVPYLGLCLGLQMAVVEFARNVCGIENAHSQEMDEEKDCLDKDAHVICRLPEQEKLRQTLGFIGTQRLGDFACIVDKNSFVRGLYEKVGRPDEYERRKSTAYDKLRTGVIKPDDFVVFERHRHRYEINPDFHGILQEKGMLFPGIHRSVDGTILIEMISWKDHPYSIASQFHPEFTSNYKRPSPLFFGFAEAVKSVKLNLHAPVFALHPAITKN